MWYYRILGEEFGPVSRDALLALIESGDLSASDPVRPLSGDWAAVSTFEELQLSSGDGETLLLDADLAELLGQVDFAADSGGCVPGVSRPVAWHVQTFGQELGPFDWDQLMEIVQRGELSPTDSVRRGEEPWQPAGEIIGLFRNEVCASDAAATSREAAEPAVVWFYEANGATCGPVSFVELEQLATSGRLTPRDRLREGLHGRWVRAATAPGLFASLSQTRSVSGLAGQTGSQADVPAQVEQTETCGAADASADASSGAIEADTAPDKWSTFFESVEAQEQKRRRRPGAPATGSAAPSTASPRSAAPNLNATPAPPPPASTPSPVAEAPRFVPTPRPRRSIQIPTFDFSGMFERLKGSGGQLNSKLLLPLVLGVVVVGWRFVGAMSLGVPGEEFAGPIQSVWNQVLQLHEQQAPATEWAALASASLPVLDEAQMKLGPIVKSYGVKAALAQRLLWLVDTADGPTRAPGVIRKILSAQGMPTDKEISLGTSLISEVASLMPPQ